MAVSRISADALQKIMKGKTNTDDKTTVVVKFYSNDCHLCHALSDYYIDISDQNDFEDIYFFAHNINDDGNMAEKLSLNGVPSIAICQTQGGQCTKTKILSDPDNPHEKTWYTSNYIKNFIRSEM